MGIHAALRELMSSLKAEDEGLWTHLAVTNNVNPQVRGQGGQQGGGGGGRSYASSAPCGVLPPL